MIEVPSMVEKPITRAASAVRAMPFSHQEIE